MKSIYRMSMGVMIIRILFPFALILLYAPFTPNPLFTIVVLELPFIVAVIYIWSANTVQITADSIINTRWIIFGTTTHLLSEVKRMQLRKEVDIFSLLPWVEIDFVHGEPIALVSFSVDDVREIVGHVRKFAPDAIDPALDKLLATGTGL